TEGTTRRQASGAMERTCCEMPGRRGSRQSPRSADPAQAESAHSSPAFLRQCVIAALLALSNPLNTAPAPQLRLTSASRSFWRCRRSPNVRGTLETGSGTVDVPGLATVPGLPVRNRDSTAGLPMLRGSTCRNFVLVSLPWQESQVLSEK